MAWWRRSKTSAKAVRDNPPRVSSDFAAHEHDLAEPEPTFVAGTRFMPTMVDADNTSVERHFHIADDDSTSD
jgi:hypothetical protein